MSRVAVFIRDHVKSCPEPPGKITSYDPCPLSKTKLRAARQSARCAAHVRKHGKRVVTIDPASDINETGLIGICDSVITTEKGYLPSKRTSLDPNYAAVAVHLLHEVGVRKGSLVACGFSGSYPGLNISVLCAVRALGARAVVISNVGSSAWGANVPEFAWLDMEAALVKKRLLPDRSVAVGLGGSRRKLTKENRLAMSTVIERSGLPMVQGNTPPLEVRRRMEIYAESAAGRPYAAFVTVGGALSNIGSRVSRGVAHEMHDIGVPVVILRNMRKIAGAFGMPWDPSPLPLPGSGAVYRRLL